MDSKTDVGKKRSPMCVLPAGAAPEQVRRLKVEGWKRRFMQVGRREAGLAAPVSDGVGCWWYWKTDTKGRRAVKGQPRSQRGEERAQAQDFPPVGARGRRELGNEVIKLQSTKVERHQTFRGPERRGKNVHANSPETLKYLTESLEKENPEDLETNCTEPITGNSELPTIKCYW